MYGIKNLKCGPCFPGRPEVGIYPHPPIMKQDPNIKGFTPDGWLITGDKGFLDETGALTLVGRFKEIINRGGWAILQQQR